MSVNAGQPPRSLIPWMIVGFFVALACLLGWFADLAVSSYTGVVTDEAYEKGLHYNDTIARARAQDALGWQGDIRLENGLLAFTLRDATGAGIDGAKVDAYAMRPVQAGKDTQVTMQAEGDGAYRARLSLPQSGLWLVEIHAKSKQGDFQVSKRVVVP